MMEIGIFIVLIIPIGLFAVASFRILKRTTACLIIFSVIGLGVGLYSYFGYYTHAKIWQDDFYASYKLRQEVLAQGALNDIIAKLQQKQPHNLNDRKN